MMLRNDWRHILRKAWSMKLMIIAGILTALEVILPLFAEDMPRGFFVGMNLVIIPAAMVARVMSQKGFQ
jgi:riboflavin transporter FmnP